MDLAEPADDQSELPALKFSLQSCKRCPAPPLLLLFTHELFILPSDKSLLPSNMLGNLRVLFSSKITQSWPTVILTKHESKNKCIYIKYPHIEPPDQSYSFFFTASRKWDQKKPQTRSFCPLNTGYHELELTLWPFLIWIFLQCYLAKLSLYSWPHFVHF